MELVGRITRHATLRTIKKHDRKVVSFTLAINDYYKRKDATEGIKLTTYIDCSYWVNPGIQKYLVQGALVEVQGRIYATAYMSKGGEPRASINCHVNTIKLHKSGSLVKTETADMVAQAKDDLPF